MQSAAIQKLSLDWCMDELKTIITRIQAIENSDIELAGELQKEYVSLQQGFWYLIGKALIERKCMLEINEKLKNDFPQ